MHQELLPANILKLKKSFSESFTFCVYFYRSCIWKTYSVCCILFQTIILITGIKILKNVCEEVQF